MFTTIVGDEVAVYGYPGSHCHYTQALFEPDHDRDSALLSICIHIDAHEKTVPTVDVYGVVSAGLPHALP